MDIRALIITAHPRPIVASQNKLIVLWSANSGCTFAIKWLFAHMELSEAAVTHPHKHRVQLYASEQHKAAVEDFVKSPASYRAVKFVMNPFKRAVSSYLQAARFGYEDAGLCEFLGRKVDERTRFSFREFVRYLKNIGLSHTRNIHHQLQVHALERRCMLASLFLVNLDYSVDTLPKLESLLGLPRTDPVRYLESYPHTRKSRESRTDFSGDTAFEVFGRAAPGVPDYRSFYDAELEDLVSDLYAEDFLRYGFSPALAGS